MLIFGDNIYFRSSGKGYIDGEKEIITKSAGNLVIYKKVKLRKKGD
jgi:hypothetical protein